MVLFYGIYGVGAAVMIIILRHFKKNNYTLFIGGCIVGALSEYIISLFGELLLGTRWWDYSNKFLNINGRICLLFTLIWGILGLILMLFINPLIDEVIDWIDSRINKKVVNSVIITIIVFLFFDTMLSGMAVNWVRTKVIVEKNIEISCKDKSIEEYEKIYNNENYKGFVDKYWTVEKILFTYPNFSIILDDGTLILVKDLYPEIHPYLYKRESS